VSSRRSYGTGSLWERIDTGGAAELARVGFEALLRDSGPQAGRMILRLTDAFAAADDQAGDDA
jgi:hypothetical protein